MDTLRRSLLLSPLVLAAGGAAAQTAAPGPASSKVIANWPEPKETIDLWPKDSLKAPAGLAEIIEETSTDSNIRFRRAGRITQPRMMVFPADKPNGGAMLIIPGGGFSWNYFDHEGYQLADFLNKQGVTCFVLFYRLANDGWENRADVGSIDALRAIRLIRFNADKYGIDPARVGVAGFSAGGFLTATLATRHGQKMYAPVDTADGLDARPFLAAPVYAVQTLDPTVGYGGAAPSLFQRQATAEEIVRYSPESNVDLKSSPCLFIHAEDDDLVPVENSTRLRDALRKNGIRAESHLFATGGHGFGMKADPEPYAVWPQLLANFAKKQGLMG